MSINVTVHGNPISIKRGKMVALDDNKEFEVRRKIRIQQVRQQSRKIAEDVRNKVKKEKNRQIGKFNNEADCAQRAKRSNNLNCLNQSIRRSLEDFGQAFRDADACEDENEVIKNLNADNRRLARLRGKYANLTLQEQKDLEEYDAHRHIHDLKYARYIEDLRSKLVSGMPKKRKRPTKKCEAIPSDGSDIHTTEPPTPKVKTPCDSNVVPCAPEFTCRKTWDKLQSDKGSCKSKPEFTRRAKSTEQVCTVRSSPEQLEKGCGCDFEECKCDPPSEPTSSSSNKENVFEKSCYIKTIVSDKSKTPTKKEQREQYEREKRWYAEFQWIKKQNEEEREGLCRPTLHSTRTPDMLSQMNRPFSPDPLLKLKKTLPSNKNTFVDKDELEDLQPVSPIKVKGKKKLKAKKPCHKSSLHDSKYCKPATVTIEYDSSNLEENVINLSPQACELPKVRTTCIKENISDLHEPLYVQRIHEDDLQIIDDDDSIEENCTRKIQRAKARGARALEKVKIQQDYQRLLQELPILEKQERLANMPCRDPSMHMSEERLREYERKRQNFLDNKFENMRCKAEAFKRPTITLKSIRKSKNPCQNLEISIESTTSSSQTTTSSTTTSTSEEPCQKPSKETLKSCKSEKSTTTTSSSSGTVCGSSKTSEEQIADLLKRVNKQRELLLKEAVQMKSLGKLKDLLNEEELINIICNCPQKPKTLAEKATSPFKVSSPCQVSSKRSITSSSDSSLELESKCVQTKPKPKKIKHKTKKFKIIVREEGTQTSPCQQKSPKKATPKKGSQLLFKRTKAPIRTVRSNKSYNIIQVERPKEPGPCKDPCPCKCQAPRKCTAKELPRPCVCNKESTSTSKSKTSSDKVEINIRVENVKVPTTETDSKSDKTCNKITETRSDVKNIMNQSTSTSYMSPPCEVQSREVQASCSSNRYLLQPQRQQTNIDNLVRVENGCRQINPRLVKYITRLLNMSRQSIDELTVSDVSDVSTPQSSILQCASNMAREKLQTVMEHFHLSADDIRNLCLSSSTTSTTNDTFKSNESACPPSPPRSQPGTSVRNNTGGSSCLKEEIHWTSLRPNTTGSSCQKEESQWTRPNTTTGSCNKDESQWTSQRPDTTASSCRKDESQWTSLRPDTTAGSCQKEGSQRTRPDTAGSSCRKDESQRTSFHPNTSASSCRKDESQYTSCRPDTGTSYRTCLKDEKSVKDETCKRPGIKFCIPKTDTATDPMSYSDNSSKQVSCAPERTSGEETLSDEIMLKDPKTFLKFVRESLGMTPEEFSEMGFEEMFSRHMELTEYCHDRIKSLMSLIDQIRKEKREICSPLEHSLTSYMDLPTSKTNLEEGCQANNISTSIQTQLEHDISTESSLSQEAIDNYLLSIGRGSGSPSRREGCQEQRGSPSKSGSCQGRLKSGDDFVSVLDGIPKYTGDDKENKMSHFLADLLQSIKPRPPPSLLRSNMKGHTNEIPHELSTIVEADTIVSSRNTTMRPRTPEGSPRKEEKASPVKGKPPSQIKSPETREGSTVRPPSLATTSKDPSTVKTSSKTGETSRESSTMRPPSPEEVPSRDTSPREEKSPSKRSPKKDSSLRWPLRPTLEEKVPSMDLSHRSDKKSSPRKEELKSSMRREEKVPSQDISPKSAKGSPKGKKEEGKGDKRTFLGKKVSTELSNSSNLSDGYVTIPFDKTLESPGTKLRSFLTQTSSSNSSGTKMGLSGIVSLSDTSQENQDELEALLKKFKLEWAISLVKKTEQAMALSSSSSSSDVLAKGDVSSESLQLKFNDLCKKLVSLNESDVDKAKIVSNLSNFKEFHDISEIVGVVDSRSKSHQRTSTPVPQHSKSTESIKKSTEINESFFKVDSELSSVKNSSDENQSSNLFLSIPNITLNTEHISLRKS